MSFLNKKYHILKKNKKKISESNLITQIQILFYGDQFKKNYKSYYNKLIFFLKKVNN